MTLPAARRLVGWERTGPANAITLMAIAVATIFLAMALRPAEQFLGGKPFVEDAYYSLTVARNIADGSGFTIDGEQLTNGVQPLFTVISALSFALTGSDIGALRFQLVLHALIALATGITVARSVAAWHYENGRGHAVGIVAFSLFLLAVNLYPTLFNGLETGLLLLAITALIYSDLGRFGSSDRRAALAGIWLGGLVLIRVDTVFLVLIYCLRALFGEGTSAERSRRAALIAGTAFLVSSPWWAYNTFVFGSPIPLSGSALADYRFDLMRLWLSLQALGWSMIPWLYLPYEAGQRYGWIVGILGLVVMITGVSFLIRSGNKTGARPRMRAALLSVFVHGAMLALWYALTSAAVSSYGRYAAVVSPAALTLTGIWAGPWLANTRRCAALAGAGFLAALAVTVIYVTGRGIQGNWHYNTVLLVEEFVRPEERVGAGQSGTLGFFRSGVVNLDGKVNVEAYRNSSRISDYLDREGLAWLVDWPYYIERFLGRDPATRGWVKVGERAGFHLYHRVRAGAEYAVEQLQPEADGSIGGGNR